MKIMKNKILCYNEGKDFAGCGLSICCFYCENIQKCNIACDIILNFEGHEKPTEECKYCKEVVNKDEE